MNRSIFFKWNSINFKDNKKNIIVNFGPQHPAAHGVLRLILQLEGEIIRKTDIHIGLLHRGTESLIQTKYYEKSIPYFDRLDYVSMMCQEHSYCIGIEQLLGIKCKNIFTNFIRILFDELTRLLNHYLAIACHALDIGSMSSLFWAFEDREKIMEFYERVSGARMHAAFHKPYNFYNYTIEKNILIDIIRFSLDSYKTLNEMHNVLTYNKIWKQRLINIGTISNIDCQNYSLTGVMIRSTGIKRDLRLSKKNNYSFYNKIVFKSFIGVNGDCYDRYLIRMLEMGQSNKIIANIIKYLNNYLTHNTYLDKQSDNLFNNILIKKNKINTYCNMEDLIVHFLNWHSGVFIKSNISSIYIESPKGEFGVSLVSNNSNKPYKCKIRSPSYFNLQALPQLVKGHYLADLSSIIGTIDIVFGEIDR